MCLHLRTMPAISQARPPQPKGHEISPTAILMAGDLVTACTICTTAKMSPIRQMMNPNSNHLVNYSETLLSNFPIFTSEPPSSSSAAQQLPCSARSGFL